MVEYVGWNYKKLGFTIVAYNMSLGNHVYKIWKFSSNMWNNLQTTIGVDNTKGIFYNDKQIILSATIKWKLGSWRHIRIISLHAICYIWNCCFEYYNLHYIMAKEWDRRVPCSLN
jgi:hypothetical protein